MVIVPGVQNSRTEEGGKLKPRANLWIPVQLSNRVHDARVWSSMGRAGLWKDEMDPSPYSRAGLMGNHTKVKTIVIFLYLSASSRVGRCITNQKKTVKSMFG